jgi:hypothetical protein
MDWEKIDSTVRELYRKNGKTIDAHCGRTPLSELISKDPAPVFDEMTVVQLCEFAADHHIAIGEGLERWELIETIKEALQTNWEERLRGMLKLLDYICADGPHPLDVYRRVVGIAKAIRPKCVLNASLRQLAVMCDDGKGRSSDGRATQSARIKRLFEKPVREAGMHGCKVGYQKDQSAVVSYSDAQQGNQNRLGSEFLRMRDQQLLNGRHKKRKAAA